MATVVLFTSSLIADPFVSAILKWIQVLMLNSEVGVVEGLWKEVDLFCLKGT
jgi:hypothetical protein